MGLEIIVMKFVDMNNRHIGMDHFVHYREAVLFQRQKCIATT